MRKLGLLIVIAFLILPFHWDGYKTNLLSQVNREESDAMAPAQHPVIFTTSLSDSIPETVLNQVGLHDVKGFKLNYRNNGYASFFAYSADKARLLNALALIPVRIGDGLSDTTYRRVAASELSALRAKVPPAELEHASLFWSSINEDVDIFESVKGHTVHLILINNTTHSILHRVSSVV